MAKLGCANARATQLALALVPALVPVAPLIRVDDGIGQVDQEIHRHHHGGQEQHHVLDHHQIAVGDGLEDQAAEAGQEEDVLDDDGAGQEVGELQAHDGDDRDHGVPQHVAPQRGAAAQPLGPGGAHVVLAEGLQDAGTCDASEDGGLHRGQGDGRQQQRFDRRPEALFPGAETARGEPAEIDREEEDQKNSEPELRHRDAELAEQNDPVIAGPAVAGGGEDAQRQRRGNGQRHGHQGQRHGDVEAFEDELAHRHRIGVAGAQIAHHQAAHPAHIAGQRRLIEAELAAQRLVGLGIGVGAQDGHGRVAGQDLERQEDHQRGAEQRGHEGDEALGEKDAHLGRGCKGIMAINLERIPFAGKRVTAPFIASSSPLSR